MMNILNLKEKKCFINVVQNVKRVAMLSSVNKKILVYNYLKKIHKNNNCKKLCIYKKVYTDDKIFWV